MKRLVFLALVVVPLFHGCPTQSPPPLVWPISGTETPDAPLSSTFGPRLKASENDRYDFHRGIDIPAPVGTAVRAIADGTVRIAGEHSSYSDIIVQITHEHEGGGVYYSNYIHLSEALVALDQVVRAGDIVGRTGIGDSGFPHLHFETRDGGLFQQNCVNPFLILPYADTNVPSVTIDSVDLSTPGNPVVTVTVSLPRGDPALELDFNAVTVEVFEHTEGLPARTDSRRYDMHEWNLAYTPLPPEDANVNLDDPEFNGVTIAPAPFTTNATEYSIQFTFRDLAGPQDTAGMRVIATAEDVRGNTSLDEFVNE